MGNIVVTISWDESISKKMNDEITTFVISSANQHRIPWENINSGDYTKNFKHLVFGYGGTQLLFFPRYKQRKLQCFLNECQEMLNQVGVENRCSLKYDPM